MKPDSDTVNPPDDGGNSDESDTDQPVVSESIIQRVFAALDAQFGLDKSDAPAADTDGRTGFLSTRFEAHAFILGVCAGLYLTKTGDVQAIAGYVGLGTATSRIGREHKQRSTPLPDKYKGQVREELPHFAGALVGTLAVVYVVRNSSHVV